MSSGMKRYICIYFSMSTGETAAVPREVPGACELKGSARFLPQRIRSACALDEALANKETPARLGCAVAPQNIPTPVYGKRWQSRRLQATGQGDQPSRGGTPEARDVKAPGWEPGGNSSNMAEVGGSERTDKTTEDRSASISTRCVHPFCRRRQHDAMGVRDAFPTNAASVSKKPGFGPSHRGATIAPDAAPGIDFTSRPRRTSGNHTRPAAIAMGRGEGYWSNLIKRARRRCLARVQR